MWPYFLLFSIPAIAALMPTRLKPGSRYVVWTCIGLLFSVVIGLRSEVGGDWFNYVRSFHRTAQMDFGSVLSESKDPGYYGLGWVISRLGGSVYALNFACAVVLMWGVVRFSRAQPWPWLALLAAVPYLLIVVGMGYTRQSAAIGFAMLGLVALGKAQTRWFVLWVLVGAAFHKSAVLLFPIAALAATRNRIWTGLWVGVIGTAGAWLFAFDSSDVMWANYVESEYADASQGGAIRVVMNAIPALLLLWFRGRLVTDPAERKLWLWMAILALACVPLVFISATAVDRVALFFIPLQLFVFSRMPRVPTSMQVRTPLVLGIVAYYGAVQFVWLNFASHAGAWLPYQFMPFWN